MVAQIVCYTFARSQWPPVSKVQRRWCVRVVFTKRVLDVPLCVFKMVCRKPMSLREVEIIRRLKKVVKLPVATIAKGIDRNKTTVYDALKKTWKPSSAGRPHQLLAKEVKHIIATMKGLIKGAVGTSEISLAVIKRRSKCKFSLRTIHRALRSKNIQFRKMRSKPILTNADIKTRFEFAKKYRHRTRSWWLKFIHMHIDNKVFPCYVNAKARAYAAQRAVRGAYRLPAQGLDQGYVVASKAMRYNPGVRSAIVSAGVGHGRVLMWDVLQQKKWTGATAAEMHAGRQRVLRLGLRSGSSTCSRTTIRRAISRRRASQRRPITAYVLSRSQGAVLT